VVQSNVLNTVLRTDITTARIIVHVTTIEAFVHRLDCDSTHRPNSSERRLPEDGETQPISIGGQIIISPHLQR
jgi:hypothetical protein